ncbi:FAD-dependent oxidoreductase [Spiroplasma tabanidicola]|uniref:NADH oxidase n=1 Tax=Spiroplasma tabanidicola TaxID=324079 RepID=A0A6I6C9N6_9MOLU|nr:FAD-dependent oxidoreductase [Spiroplasma tabanidicola]QGS51611.1 NADH oxidase [Spiroplasma tabanidicola]
MKTIVIGTNHAGTTAVRTLKRLNPEMEVSTYERNDNISFLGCGIALWVQGEVKDPNGLFYASPEILANEGVQTKMEHDWVGINPKAKTVRIKNLKTGEEFDDNYDKLIVATGTWPIFPNIDGINLENIQICKNYHHAQKIKAANENKSIKKVVVVGAGYIGVELVDAFVKAGKEVSLVDIADRIMPLYYDGEFTKLVENEMKSKNVNLALNQKVVKFVGENGKVTKVVTDKSEIEADYVVFSVGVKPQTDLLKGIVDLDNRGAIKTNEFMQSSNPDIYAVGDCAQVYNVSLKQDAQIALATTAVRTGILAAVNIVSKNTLKSPGFTGANGIDVFGWKMASVGVSKNLADKYGIEVEEVMFKDSDRPEFMSTYKDVYIKIVWEKKSRKIIGAQVASLNNHTEVMYMFALAVQKELTIDELPLVDIFFLPHFNKPYNFITLSSLEVLGLNYFKK